VESIEALEDAIERYEGTILLVSHDRALLRSVVGRVWVLHDRRITSFDGSFAEWEVVSAERQHAAQVQAQEEEALRRLKEKQKTARREPATTDDGRKALRKAQRTVEELEERIAGYEARITELTTTLEDPTLYTTPNGVETSVKLGAELERVKTQLDREFAEWTAATEALERLGAV
jgi:ATP-binding cassette subfamily F protein 3